MLTARYWYENHFTRRSCGSRSLSNALATGPNELLLKESVALKTNTLTRLWLR